MTFQWATTVSFLKVPFKTLSSGHSFKWSTIEEQQAYFESCKVAELEIEKSSYMRINGGTCRLKYNDDQFKSLAPNMIMYKNANFGDKWFYADITSDTYINKNLTEVNYAIDSLQSFYFDLDLSKQSYIARRTVFSEDGSNYIANLPLEELSLGSDYVSTGTYTDYLNSDEAYNTGTFVYLILTKPLLKSGNAHEIKTGEVTVTDITGTATTISNGKNSIMYGYVMNYQCFNECLNKGLFSEDCDLVNSLQLVVDIPFGRDMFPESIENVKSLISTTTTPDMGEQLTSACECYSQEGFGWLYSKGTIPAGTFDGLCYQVNKAAHIESNSQPTTAIAQHLLRYPYSLLQVYDYYNQPTNLRLEGLQLDETDGVFDFLENGLQFTKYGTIGQTPTLSYTVARNGNLTIDAGIAKSIDDGGIANLQTINFITNQSTFSYPIINDYASSYMQSNANQINAQKTNLAETKQVAILNAGANLQATAQTSQIQYNATVQTAGNVYTNTLTNSLLNQTTSIANALNTSTASQLSNLASNTSSMISQMGTSASQTANASSLAAAGGIAMATGTQALSTVLNSTAKNNSIQTEYLNAVANASTEQLVKANDASTAYTNAQINATANRQISMTGASTSYANSMRSAHLNYNTQMRALNAKLLDVKNVPAQVQTMGNYQSTANTMYNRDGITFTPKTLTAKALERVANYWVYNGMLVNDSETIESILSKASGKAGVYIQTIDANIGGNIPNDNLEQIKQILDSGITLWDKDHFKDFEAMYSL